MKKIVIILLIGITFIVNLSAQQVELTAPPLAGKKVKLYYFEGAKVDSLLTHIGSDGKASLTIPIKDYRGMVALVVSDAGGIELVVAEPQVLIKCNDTTLSKETAEFPASKENKFLNHLFTSQTLYVQQEAWLKAGLEFFPDSPIAKDIFSELAKVESNITKLQWEVSASKLYAARYFEVSHFMNRLYNANMSKSKDEALSVRRELEEDLDIVSLYRSGRLWESIPNFYISMFNHTAGEFKQEEFADSMFKVASRLGAPYFETWLSTFVTETERFGWKKAQSELMEKLLTRYPGLTSDIPNLQRAIASHRIDTDQAMPDVVGVNYTEQEYKYTIVAFHDSDCGSCLNEMFRLRVIYPSLKDKNIRVISIAADVDKLRFEDAVKDFPWEDKLCDFKGFEGINFSNYNVIGSPAFYLLDKEKKLQGMYFNVGDLEEAVSQVENVR